MFANRLHMLLIIYTFVSLHLHLHLYLQLYLQHACEPGFEGYVFLIGYLLQCITYNTALECYNHAIMQS